MSTTTFRNPANGYEERVSMPGLWCLLFGCFYLAYKGAWGWAALAFLAAWFTFGISWLVFPFFARRLVEANYMRKGWVHVGGNTSGYEATSTPESLPAAPAPAPATAAVRQQRRTGKLVLVGLAVFIALPISASLIMNFLGSGTNTATDAKQSSPAEAVPVHLTTGTENVANDRMLALPRNEQAAMLAQAVGEGCKGDAAFFMGLGKKEPAVGEAFWSVRCTDGRNYSVAILPDATGSTQVLECSVLKAVAGVECFKKFSD